MWSVLSTHISYYFHTFFWALSIGQMVQGWGLNYVEYGNKYKPPISCKCLSWYGNRVSISEDKCYFTTQNLWNLTNHIYKLNIEYKHIRISNSSQYLNYCIRQKGCIRVYYWLILKRLASIWKLQPPSNSEECSVCSLNKIHSNSKCCCLF